MMKPVVLAALVSGGLLLTACESSEDRAEEHFQEGLALLEAGDVDRALVEFRNVFRLDAMHKEARRAYAVAELDRGNVGGGFGQYLRLLEQYPDDIEARRAVTQIAMSQGDWEQVERYAPQLISAEPEEPISRLADISLRYREAVGAEDAAARQAAAEEAEALRDVLPDMALIPELLADNYVRQERREDALDELSRAIELSPEDRRLYTMRLSLLQEMGDYDAVEENLRRMIEQFPEDATIPATLIRWYLSRDNVVAAEQFLRDRAAREEDTGADVDLFRFLTEFRGPEAAIAEIDSALAGGGLEATDELTFRSLRAGLQFQLGEREEAVAAMQSLIDSAEEGTQQLRNLKVAQAQMLRQTGNQVGARALVEDVLSTDPTNVAAIKMQAQWLIDADETDEAIQQLRSALEQSPRDPDLMTLIARAHERAGNRELMSEMLSLAVEASNRAPAETLRYARYLVSEDNVDVAERALMDSLQLNAANVDLLRALAEIYIRRSDWARAEQVRSQLDELGTPEAEAAANGIQAQVLASQGRTEDVIGFLEGLVETGAAGYDAQAAIVQAHIRSGELDLARDYVEDRLESEGEEPTLLLLHAAVLEAAGETGEAEEGYRALTEAFPEAVVPWRALYLLQSRDGRAEDAAQTLDSALEANPQNLDLLWIKASETQRSGDLEMALSIYEKMYEIDSSTPVIANNYASLLTMLREDDEAIERAFTVARRLRDLEEPAFQDTYGWIAFLRGDHQTALAYLEPAAEALTNDPAVQYHVAMAYEAAGRTEEAAQALRRAIELVDEGGSLPQAERARERLAELESVVE